MSDNNKTTSSAANGGIGVFGLLTVVFVCAKIFGLAPVASWPWWQVLIFPIIGVTFSCGLFAVILVVGFFASRER